MIETLDHYPRRGPLLCRPLRHPDELALAPYWKSINCRAKDTQGLTAMVRFQIRKQPFEVFVRGLHLGRRRKSVHTLTSNAGRV